MVQTSFPLAVSERVRKQFRCPNCTAGLRDAVDGLQCVNEGCGAEYPVVDGVPVLVKRGSLFDRDVRSIQRVHFRKRGKLGSWVSAVLPSLSVNVSAGANLRRFAEAVRAGSTAGLILVIGGAQRGKGVDALEAPDLECIDTDVELTPATKMILDAHVLPFADGTFDGVVAQAVLEHVIDPFVCVEEIHRVLKPGGIVYAEIPFMQQVHGRGYDFHRFTRLGVMHLFKKFQAEEAGGCCGPGMALAWSIQYLLLSFTESRVIRSALKGACRLTLFWLKYLDYYLLRKNASLDAASCYYYLGRKSGDILDDRTLIASYCGAQR